MRSNLSLTGCQYALDNRTVLIFDIIRKVAADAEHRESWRVLTMESPRAWTVPMFAAAGVSGLQSCWRLVPARSPRCRFAAPCAVTFGSLLAGLRKTGFAEGRPGLAQTANFGSRPGLERRQVAAAERLPLALEPLAEKSALCQAAFYVLRFVARLTHGHEELGEPGIFDDPDGVEGLDDLLAGTRIHVRTLSAATDVNRSQETTETKVAKEISVT